nr:MAG TPA: hypothetical protein [Caudoviricetes sp.]
MDPDNFPKVKNPMYHGINGIIDISKPLSITINLE